MKRAEKAILVAVLLLLASWMLLNREILLAGRDGIIRLVLGTLLAGLILFRRKPEGAGFTTRVWLLVALALLGAGLSVLGIIFGVHQFQWLGLLLLVYACLAWALPARYAGDIVLGLVLFYWVHPIPSQLFGPLQMGMQRLSILGAEWVLHIRDIPVWADQLVLQTGRRVFGVPETCSGMRLVVTVLLCTLGTGILLRLRWYQTLVLLPLGLVQVLALNVLRLALMVRLGNVRPVEWAETFLHDTLGIFLLAALFVVQAEASLCSLWTKRGWHGRIRPALRWTGFVLAATLAIGLLVFGLRKRRPAHRAAMINAVAERFVEADRYADAERASAFALRLAPDHSKIRTTRARVLMLRHRYPQALELLGGVPRQDRDLLHVLLEARGQIGAGNREAGIGLIEALPEQAKGLAAFTFLRAELAAYRGDVPAVSENLIATMKQDSMWLIPGIRTFFPFLAKHEQWRTIVACRAPQRFRDVEQLLIAVHADIKTGALTEAGDLLRNGLKRWPDEARLCGYLGALAALRPGSGWEARYETDLRARLDRVDLQALLVHVPRCFRLGRPDLAWLAWHRLASLAGGDPALDLLLAQVADLWFSFRKQHVGVPAGDPIEFVDLKDFYFVAEAWPRAPLVDELGEVRAQRWHKKYVLRCVQELEAREKRGVLSTRMKLMFPVALQAARRFEDALAWMDRLENKKETERPRGEERAAAEAPDELTEEEEMDERTHGQLKAYRDGREEDKLRRLLAERMRKYRPTPLQLTLSAGLAVETGRDAAMSNEERFRQGRALLREVQAHMRTNAAPVAMHGTLERMARVWGGSQALARYLASRGAETPHNGWCALFEERCRTELAGRDSDALVGCLQGAFRLSRPDLAWAAYDRLASVSPDDPALYLAAAMYGEKWFVFKKRAIGLPASRADETLDVRTLYLRHLGWTNAPLAAEFKNSRPGEMRERYLARCLTKLDRREKKQDLPLRLHLAYVTALELAGRNEDAHARVELLGEKGLLSRAKALMMQALMYQRERKWQHLYEVTRHYLAVAAAPSGSVRVMQINALMHLDFGLYALLAGQQALAELPGSLQVQRAMSSVLAVLGESEEALFLLQRSGRDFEPAVAADLYFETGRRTEAKRIRMVHGLTPFPEQERQALLLPRAEQAAKTERWGPALEPEQMSAESKHLAREAERAASPFVAGVLRCKADWYRMRGRGDSSDPAKWLAVGRDGSESAIAGTELAILLARHNRIADAAAVAEQVLPALAELPAAWRVLITLKGGAPEVVKRAYKACPEDSSIWLAHLVVRAEEEDAQAWAEAEIERVVARGAFPVETLVRAGDFLRRRGLMKAAEKAARHAAASAQGTLPAYLLGLRCALAAQDADWALACAMRGVEHAQDPWPFYRVYAAIKASRHESDESTVAVLTKLAGAFPDEPYWTRSLGEAHLRRGDSREALRLLDKLVAGEPVTRVDLRTLLLAAEAARQAGDLKKALSILEPIYAQWPDNRVVLNNLVYCLASDPATLPRAQAMLPKLLGTWGDSFAALDTAAFVHRMSRNWDSAAAYLEQVHTGVERVDPWWLVTNPRAVDIDGLLGEYDVPDDAPGGGLDPKVHARLEPMAEAVARRVKERAALARQRGVRGTRVED